jgi:hypothetical protein
MGSFPFGVGVRGDAAGTLPFTAPAAMGDHGMTNRLAGGLRAPVPRGGAAFQGCALCDDPALAARRLPAAPATSLPSDPPN